MDAGHLHLQAVCHCIDGKPELADFIAAFYRYPGLVIQVLNSFGYSRNLFKRPGQSAGRPGS